MIEWYREDVALITNLPARELPMTAVGQDRFPKIPLLAPSAGLIVEFLRRWYGPNFTTPLRIVVEVDSIYYGLALLRSQLVRDALICARAAADAAVEGCLSGGPNLRLIPLADGYNPQLQLLAEIFTRKAPPIAEAWQRPAGRLYFRLVRVCSRASAGYREAASTPPLATTLTGINAPTVDHLLLVVSSADAASKAAR
jgi:hypothetical protein